MSALLCPKCTNIMTRYERNGIVVDQCVGCGGLFLDRGELEHLVKAEAVYYGHDTVAPPPAEPREYQQRPLDERSSRDSNQEPSRDREYDRKRKKKKAYGFLEDLLDF